MARSITGSEILEFFEWTEHELIEAVQGGLAPFDPIYGGRITREKDPCLYCDGGEIVDHSVVLEHHILSDSGGLMSAPGGLMGEYEAYTKMRRCSAVTIPAGSLKGPWLCKDRWQREELAKRLLETKFLTAEVQEYALSHGLPVMGQDFTPPIAPAVSPSQDQQAEMGTRPAVVPLPTRPGTTWDQIHIRVAKRNRIEIWRPGYDMQDFNLDELGLAKARNKMAILKEFGRGKKKLKRGLPVASPQTISNLRKHIKSMFPEIEGDPIIAEDEMYKKNYVCQFEISVSAEVYSEEYYKKDEVQDDDEDWKELIKNNR